ncbi:MAG TPA: ArsC family reductase [Gammaproteobacteria bacterium]|nr:ArsC family reductase [Gammaproteobacteria bacterium]
MTVIYGIKNCDTVRKAIKWLNNQGIEYTFHDFRKDGIDEPTVHRWISAAGWETVLNKRGLSWRQLSDEDKKGIDDNKAMKLILENPTLVKRPVLVDQDEIHIGFNEDIYTKIFNR